MRTHCVQAVGVETDDNGRLVDRTGKPRDPSSLRAESIKDIAKQYGVSADAIFAANREIIGSNPANVPLGATLVIPDKIGGE